MVEDSLTKLEKLAELRAKGVLTEEEFLEQKAALLGAAPSRTTIGNATARGKPENAGADVSEKWRQRFEFFRAYGHPASSEAKANLREKDLSGKLLITFNFFAFFFGILYFAFLGLWKKAAGVLALWIVIVVVADALHVSGDILKALPFAVGALCATTVNYAYYLKKTRDIDTWNPFSS